MDINNNSNISNVVASSLSKINLTSTPRAQKTPAIEQNEAKIDIKEEDTKLMDTKKVNNAIDVNDIQKYANSMGETLTIEDINYGLMYGRSVIADYSI